MALPDTADAEPPVRRPRDPDRTKRDILVAAREEFVEHGLDGARVDRIAERAGANKRMLYHYVGNKEALYACVLLERLPRDPRRRGGAAPRRAASGAGDGKARRLHLRPLPRAPVVPAAAATENIQRAAFINAIPEIRALHSPLVAQIREVLAAGEAMGIFRAGVDPVQLYITVAGISYFYMSNIHTLSVIFDTPLDSEPAMAARRAHGIAVVLGYLRPGMVRA